MMKRFFLILLILIILVSVGIIYLNKVILPVKIKSLIISTLEEATHKKVSLKEIEFNLFKGLVLKNLILSDGAKTLVSVDEATFRFLIFPIFKKNIIIPTVKLKSPLIFLERRADNTFNLVDLFPSRLSPQAKPRFNLFIYKISLKNGRVDFQDNTLSPAFTKSMDNLNLILSLSLPNRLKFKLDCQIQSKSPMSIKALGEFSLRDRQLTSQLSIKDFSPREFLSYYKDSNFFIPEVKFDTLINLELKNNLLNADLVSENILGLPLKAKVNLTDFKNPLLNINLTSNLELNILEKILKDNFKFNLPVDIQGKGSLTFNLENRLPLTAPPKINGSFDISNATLKSKEFGSLENISGRLGFSLSQVSWSGLNFNYRSITYKTSGTLVDFQNPQVQLQLSSAELLLASDFRFKDELITVNKCEGNYLNSKFLIQASLNPKNLPNLDTVANGRLSIDFDDAKGFLKKFAKQWERVNPKGSIDAKFNINGNLKDIKSCAISALLTSPAISLYGLKTQDIALNYEQANGLAEVSSLHASLYDGMLEASAKMNLNSENLPYWTSITLEGVKIEKLKFDTAFKEKDIAGNIVAEAKLNGFSNDLSKLNGAGKIFISEGRLWQLNLFKGLGELLFARDFANIIFNEGYASFIIQDKYIFSEDIKLKSNFVNLSGICKIGFDNSIDASANIEVLDEYAPISGTFKDIATAIIGQAGRFGVIKISGTLKEPKYKFKPAVVDILKSLKDAIFRN